MNTGKLSQHSPFVLFDLYTFTEDFLVTTLPRFLLEGFHFFLSHKSSEPRWLQPLRPSQQHSPPGLPGPLWAAGHLSQVPSWVLFEEGPSVLPTPPAGAKNTRVVAQPPPCLSERLAFQPRSHQILLITHTRRWHTLAIYVFALNYICVIVS